MQPINDRQARQLLSEYHRTRDVRIRNELAMYLYDKWLYRAKKMFSIDPAVSADDMRQVFLEGILEGIEKDKGIGDSLYYIGQNGHWRLSSLVRAMAARRRGLVPEDPSDLAEYRIRDTEGDFSFSLINRVGAKMIVEGLEPRLSARARDTFEILMSGVCGDPDEKGHNKRLAQELGVSEQRASQLMASLREELEDYAGHN